MTREEIIEQLDGIIGAYEILIGNGVNSDILDVDDIEAIREAISVLSAEPCEDCISRQAVIDKIYESRKNFNNEFDQGFFADKIRALPPVTPQEPKADYKAFARWVADEIFSDKWELNKDAFAEIACRRLAELGMVEESGDRWVLMESEVQDADSD